MGGLSDFWSGLFEARHRELLREASQERLADGLRRARKRSPAGRPERPEAGLAPPGERTIVRPGNDLDASRIAVLLELNGMPRWVAFEERFLVVERGGALAAAMRFREGTARLHLGLLVVDPWVEEHAVAGMLYSRARAIARARGMREVRVRTRRHQDQLYEAGYRRRGGTWRAPA